MDLTIRVASDLSGVDPAAWNALDHAPSPFLEHGFLRALEISGSIGGQSGWDPCYILAELRGADGAVPRLVGAVPCFVKHHSYGEYIFDFGWARASARAGLSYYPKLVVAAPVTPATGRRILLLRGEQAPVEPSIVARVLIEAVRELADELKVSSIHWLFTTQQEQALLAEAGFMARSSFQFHWRNDQYEDFDAFLARLSSRKRKQIRKERRRALEAVDDLEFIAGADLDDTDLDAMDRFYRLTTYRHGGQDYLRPGFFHTLRDQLSDRIQFARVRSNGETIAGALYLETEQGLYGRYWGCTEEIEYLHFETAYYAGIDRCIRNKIPLFEAGAQGEHKLLRGFVPAPTYSGHWIRSRPLADAVRRFLQEEACDLERHMEQLGEYAPFKKQP